MTSVRLPYPHPGQQVVLAHPARFKWLDAGRRWRKTTLDMIVAVEDALHGLEVMWGGPTYDQVRIGWSETKHAAGGIARFSETRMEAEFPQTGGLIRFRSLDDPDNARGFTAHKVIVDEAGDVPEAAWYEVLRPMLMTTGGGALVNGTAKGRNWFWRELLRAQSDDHRNAAAWQVPTVGARIEHDSEGGRRLVRQPHPMENPDIPWHEIVAMFETLPERAFRQEVLAEFLDDAGGVFHNVRACIHGQPLSEPDHYSRYVIGCDLAKHQDFTVLSVADEATGQQVAHYRWQHQEWPLTKALIIAKAKQWNDAVVWLDTTGLGDPIYDDLKRAGIRVQSYKFTAASKAAAYDNLTLMIEQQQVGLLDIPVQTNELEAFQVRRTAAGNYVMGAPEGLHDDCCTALALMCWPLAHRSQGIPKAALEQMTAGPISDFHGYHIMERVF